MKLLTIQEVAAKLGFKTPRSVARAEATDDTFPRRFPQNGKNGRIRYAEKDVDAWIKGQVSEVSDD